MTGQRVLGSDPSVSDRRRAETSGQRGPGSVPSVTRQTAAGQSRPVSAARGVTRQ